MPDLTHFWQRLKLASALVFGLAVGVGASVFAYSNTATVNVGWSVFRLHAIPLWSVALVPLAVFLVAGTLYHWWNSLHHFTEHMRHRKRVHDLEVEVATLRKHLDELLQMPGQSGAKQVTAEEEEAAAAPAMLPASSANGLGKSAEEADVAPHSDAPEPVEEPVDGAVETETPVLSKP